MTPAAFTWHDLADLTLSIFLIVVGLTLGYALWRLGGAFVRLSSLIRGTEEEIVPLLNKVGGTVDRVNTQLDKVDRMTDSAADAVTSVDAAVRKVTQAVTRPVQKLAGLATGISHGASAFRAQHDWRSAVDEAKEAAARRERDLGEDLAGEEPGDSS